jgi:serine protease
MHGNGARPGGSGGSTSPLLGYRSGAVQTAPAVYLVFWGSQWTGNDSAGEAARLQNFLGGLYGGADTWSTSTTQYCQGVASGSTNCSLASSGNTISHPANSPLLGVWNDNTVTAPTHPKQSQLAAEAVRAAGHFAALAGFNSKAQFVIATAHNNNASGFGSSYCAWHSSTSSTYGSLAYTNLPYMPDAGASCGANFVNAVGPLDGVTIVEGHEYAETVSDPFPNSGWLDANGAENGDKCAWIRSGQGKSSNITISSGTFPVQSLWSNNFNGVGGCVITYVSASSQG